MSRKLTPEEELAQQRQRTNERVRLHYARREQGLCVLPIEMNLEDACLLASRFGCAGEDRKSLARGIGRLLEAIAREAAINA